MNELDAPATKRDLLELRQTLQHELAKLDIKVDAYWQAANHIQRLAFGMVGTAVVAIVAAALTVILRGPS